MEKSFVTVMRIICASALVSSTAVFANQVNVSTVADLTSATLGAKAGDTIWVTPGKYELPTSNCKNDKFVNETGRDCGLIWLGADGTKLHWFAARSRFCGGAPRRLSLPWRSG